MTSAISSLRASSIALSASTRASASVCWRPFSTIPASRSAIAPSWATSCVAERRAAASVWTLSTPTIWSCQVSGTRQHRGDEAALVDAADPQEAGVGPDVGDDQRLARRGDAAGDALAERHARPADLEAVEAVGRGQRQVRSIAVEQVERGDVGVERVAGPVDDGLEQLVPRPRGRREARDLVQEAQLLELVRRRPSTSRAGASAGDGRATGARRWTRGSHDRSRRITIQA